MSKNQAPDPSEPTKNNWRESAACLDKDQELFFTELIGKGRQAKYAYHKSINDAKAVCRICPVTSFCLEAALDFDRYFKDDPDQQNIGVWGGLTKDERDTLLKRKRL